MPMPSTSCAGHSTRGAKVDGAITEEAFASYRQAFESPGAIHAACEDYRASATIDLEHDLVDDRRDGDWLCPCSLYGV